MTIDLRSDTVTQPTPAMRRAILEAQLGDDAYGDDPTVNRLEQMAAERMGKEAAVLVASGTMGNLVCGLARCKRGDELIVGDNAHIFLNESGNIAALGGVQVRAVAANRRGMMDPGQVEAAIRKPGIHFPRTALVCLENTHNRGNGAAFTPEEMSAIADVAHAHDIPIHLDGARIFNAAVALGVSPAQLATQADSVTFCLSKGLSCPVGSVVCGTQEFIAEARRMRELVGGGMRQAGIIAAPGIVALETMVDRLAEDHANARKLADGLAKIPGLSIDPTHIETNIVYVGLLKLTAEEFVSALKARGILANGIGNWVRFVTHYGITAEDIELALDAIEGAAKANPVAS